MSGLSFSNITFTGTSWLGPSGSQGYADQQSGTFITGTWQQPAFGGCSRGCQLFEATRQSWDEMPAAVQVAAATNITFSNETFTKLGEVGRGGHRTRSLPDAGTSALPTGPPAETMGAWSHTNRATGAGWSPR